MKRVGGFKRCENVPHDLNDGNPPEVGGPDLHWWNNGEGRYWPEGDERNNDYWCDGSAAPEAEGDDGRVG